MYSLTFYALPWLEYESRPFTPFQMYRAKFAAVKEDLMLLAVGVIGASAFLLHNEDWNQVRMPFLLRLTFLLEGQQAVVTGVTKQTPELLPALKHPHRLSCLSPHLFRKIAENLSDVTGISMQSVVEIVDAILKHSTDRAVGDG
ncbi:UNVERIFIED_CONTAM: hypothetical protein K2H54_007186 [Gekko kuhli]